MIYTLTLNPAVDYVMNLEKVDIGSIMRSKDEHAYFGGKGINVSQILKQLGGKSTCLGFTAGFTGRWLCDGLLCDEIKTDFVMLEKGMTRINVKLRACEETDINANGPNISQGDMKRLFEKLCKLVSGDILILAGSIPSCLSPDLYERILQSLDGKGIMCVVDASGDLLTRTLPYKPFLIKPNNDELSDIFGTNIDTFEQAEKHMKALQSMGAVNVLVSFGGKGAVLLDEYGIFHKTEAHKGTVINTVGAGDSMVAGFIFGYLKSGDYQYALKLASTCGSATAFCEGLATKEDIEKLSGM